MSSKEYTRSNSFRWARSRTIRSCVYFAARTRDAAMISSMGRMKSARMTKETISSSSVKPAPGRLTRSHPLGGDGGGLILRISELLLSAREVDGPGDGVELHREQDRLPVAGRSLQGDDV